MSPLGPETRGADGAREAIASLTDEGAAIAAAAWPAGVRDPALPGLYAWWVDAAGADSLSIGLGEILAAGLVYAGQAGATRWPSGKVGKATLLSRIGGQHLRGNVRGSTFRRTLAAILCQPLDLKRSASGLLVPEGERLLSDWMLGHLSVSVCPVPNRDDLAALERAVLQALDPPLNLDGMPDARVRVALTARRRALNAI